MKITNKIKIAFICCWVVTIAVMMAGSVAIARSFTKSVLGDEYGIQAIYSQNSPAKAYYSNLVTLRDQVEATLMKDPTVYLDAEYLKQWEESMSSNTAVMVLYDGDFIYTGVTESVEELEEALLDKKEIYNAGTAAEETAFDSVGYHYEYVVTTPDGYMCAEIDYVVDGAPLSIFLVTYYGDYVTQFRQAIKTLLFLVFLVMLLLSSMVSMVMHVHFVKPLYRLQKATEEIGAGNLHGVLLVDDKRKDEIGDLHRSFSDMRGKLRESVELTMQYEQENRELISNISHDLKTPITTIKGYVEGLIDGVADTPEKQERYLKMIASKANELDVLINELSLYTNINNNAIPYEFHRIRVADYFKDSTEEIAADLQARNMTFAYKNYVADDVRIVADPDQLRRVMGNIVTNAVKYSDKEEGHVEMYVHDAGDMVKVSISDNGRGIDEESLPHIFDRTYRADAARQSRGGSGLGLAICKKIVEEHGGKIWATSKKGAGTTIYFTLKKYMKEGSPNE